jgi:hypothetical protein
MVERIGAPAGLALDAAEPWARGLCVDRYQRRLCQAVGAPVQMASGHGFTWRCRNAPTCAQDPLCQARYSELARMRPTAPDRVPTDALPVGLLRLSNGKLLQVYLDSADQVVLEVL